MLEQLRRLQQVFEKQNRWHLYSASALLVYEGAAECREQLRPRLWLVDFAHAFDVEPTTQGRDENMLAGLHGLSRLMERAMIC